jgi:hypothetical protein
MYLQLLIPAAAIVLFIVRLVVINQRSILSAYEKYTAATISSTPHRRLEGGILGKINECKDAVTTVLDLIRYRYELDDGRGMKLFLTANNIGSVTWDVIKYKFARKILDSAVKGPQKFLMVFGGSSVTAGHDNYYNQSYPFVVERRLGPALKAVGVELVVHNIAQGANPCIPYSFCYETMGGADFDFLGWEQSYNCGGDDAVHEMTARMAYHSANKAVVYYSASGAWTSEKCPASNRPVPYASEAWSPRLENIPRWPASPGDINHEKEALFNFNNNRESANR